MSRKSKATSLKALPTIEELPMPERRAAIIPFLLLRIRDLRTRPGTKTIARELLSKSNGPHHPFISIFLICFDLLECVSTIFLLHVNTFLYLNVTKERSNYVEARPLDSLRWVTIKGLDLN